MKLIPEIEIVKKASRDEFLQLRQARDIFWATPADPERLLNLPKYEKVHPIEEAFYRRCGVRFSEID